MAISIHPRLETFNFVPGDFASFVSRYAGRHSIAPHFHPRLELVAFSGVGGQIRVGNRSESITEGQTYIIGPNAIHSYELEPIVSDHAAWVLIVDLDTLAQTLSAYGSGVKEMFLDVFAGVELVIDRQKELAGAIRLLVEMKNAQGKNKSAGSPAEAALSELATLFSAVQLAVHAVGEEVIVHQEKVPGHIARRVIALIREKAPYPLDLDEIATACAVSKYHLCRIFKEATGYSVGRYLTRVRIDRACTLLAGGSSVTEACNESGFGNLSHFIKTFRIHTGSSPLVWARMPVSAKTLSLME
ncbi:MAG: helix-turn-helix domain-containing protein [Clostridia bacterium]|jgi:AraC-like DNA-binding protein